MANWGYSIHTDRQIDFDQNDRSVYFRVIEKEPTFRKCISCGSCSATCSSASFTDFNIRKIFILTSRGEIAGLKNELGKCMLCGKCILVCPRGVNTRNVILTLRQELNYL